MQIQARKIATKFPVQNSKVWSEAGEGYQSGCSIWMPPDREAYPPPSLLPPPTACLSVSASQVESFISSGEREGEREGGEILVGVEREVYKLTHLLGNEFLIGESKTL